MVKKHLKTFFYSLGILALILIFTLLFSLACLIDIYGIQFSSSNIDDRYGKLDTNTKLVLENEFKSKMNEKNVDLYFSFVYEDLNENYIESITKNEKAILIYYNDISKKIDVVSNLKLKNNNFEKTLTAKDDISTIIPLYLDSICDNIDETTNHFYIENKNYQLIFIAIACIDTLIFLSFIGKYIKYMINYIKDVKITKTKKKVSKVVKTLDNSEIENKIK